MKYILTIFLIVLIFSNALAQTGIGTTTPNASAKLDVYSTNKGFLPPRVTLTSVTDATTIASPAEGLLVYNLGSVGLQAGYYYWNGANWATIATATSAGNGVTASDMVKIYDGIGSAATINTNGATFSVTTSGKYAFDFSSSASCANCTLTLNFQVRDGSNNNSVIGSDMQTSFSNNVHAEYNGKVEVNLTAGRSYNVLVTASAGGIYNNDYTRVYMKQVSGNLPVTGQTVDYAIASLSTNQSITTVSNVPFNTIQGTGITLTNGGFNLLANKTYKLEAEIGGSSTGYGYYGWADGSNNLLSGGSVGTVMQAGAAHTDAPQGKAVVYYTPTSNTTVYLRIFIISGTVTAYAPSSSSSYSSTWATISQIGSSAIINPWILSGTTTTNITGNVGIGTLTPTATLDVTGNTNVSGILTAGGNAFPTTSGVNGQALTTNGSGTASWNPVPPVGVISAFAGSTAPIGYLLCDGSAVSRTTYSALYAIIGTTYGTGNGSTTFNLPDLRSKMIVGVGQGSGLTNRTLASTGGIESKTLSISEMPSHNHTITDPGHTHSQTTVNDDFNNSGGNPPGFTADGAGSRTWTNISSNTTGITINSTGGGTAFSVMNPFLALNYIIKY